MSQRTCSKCGVSKPETLEFFRSRGTKDRGGLRPDCRECSAARDKAYYEANCDRVREYRKENAERIAAYQAIYIRAYQGTDNGKRAQARATQRWERTDSGRASRQASNRNRRARLKGVEVSFTRADWVKCRIRFGGRCAYCGKPTHRLTQDHVIPLQSRGPHAVGNIVPACLSCNSSKRVASLNEWYPRQPFFSEERLVMIHTYLASVS